MSKNTAELRTLTYVLRRTNYGEADRILTLLTPQGKISALARGVRKEKSKLAGGIEMFCLSDINIHQGRGELGIITSAKMLKFYANLTTDFARLELASTILKKIAVATDATDNPDFFKITDTSLKFLNAGLNQELVAAWFWFNFAKACGEQINLYRDINGAKLIPNQNYFWDVAENALRPAPDGNITTDAIKLMRLLLTADLDVVARIKNTTPLLPPILAIACAINKV